MLQTVEPIQTLNLNTLPFFNVQSVAVKQTETVRQTEDGTFLPLVAGDTMKVILTPYGVQAFTLPLIEGEQVRLWAAAMGNIDVFIGDRFDLPVAYGLTYTNPNGSVVNAEFPALGTGEYLLRVVNHTDQDLHVTLRANLVG